MQGGIGMQDMVSLLLGNLRAKFSEMSFPHLRPILHKFAIVTFKQQFKTIDSDKFTVSSMFSFQNAWPIKRKAVYISVQ